MKNVFYEENESNQELMNQLQNLLKEENTEEKTMSTKNS